MPLGPLVLVGAGGMLAQLYADYALRLAPVSEQEAATMTEEVKGLVTLRGYLNACRHRGTHAPEPGNSDLHQRLPVIPGRAESASRNP